MLTSKKIKEKYPDGFSQDFLVLLAEIRDYVKATHEIQAFMTDEYRKHQTGDCSCGQ
jgi:hypothetical protein